MKISEDVQALMDKLEKGVDAGGKTNVLRLLSEVLELFDQLKQILPTTNAAERQEIFTAMGTMHAFLQQQTRRLSDASGLSEQQLAQFAENPDNFTKEQWNLLLEVKGKMGEQAKELKQVMKSIPGPFMPAPEAFLDHMKKLDPSQSQKSHLIPQKSRGKKGQIKA